jgi:hypothetical protein
MWHLKCLTQDVRWAGRAVCLSDGSDILAARQAGYQLNRWTTLWTRCAETPVEVAWGVHTAVYWLSSMKVLRLLAGKI